MGEARSMQTDILALALALAEAISLFDSSVGSNQSFVYLESRNE
jgi:hypothetical protein